MYLYVKIILEINYSLVATVLQGDILFSLSKSHWTCSVNKLLQVNQMNPIRNFSQKNFWWITHTDLEMVPIQILISSILSVQLHALNKNMANRCDKEFPTFSNLMVILTVRLILNLSRWNLMPSKLPFWQVDFFHKLVLCPIIIHCSFHLQYKIKERIN